MAFESFSDLVSMCYVTPIGVTRCHGSFVWVSYAIGISVFVANIVAVYRRRSQVVNQIRRKIRRESKS